MRSFVLYPRHMGAMSWTVPWRQAACISCSLYRTLSQESRTTTHDAWTYLRVHYKQRWGGQDKDTSGMKMLGSSEKTRSSLTSPGLGIQTGVDSRADLPRVLYCCSYRPSQGALILSFFPPLPCVLIKWSQHLLPLESPKVIEPRAFP